MRGIAAASMVLAGVGLAFLGVYLGLGEALCEGQRPGGCPDHADALIWLVFYGGLGLVVSGVGLGMYAVVRWAKGPTPEP